MTRGIQRARDTSSSSRRSSVLLRAWPGSARPGRCKYCKHAIIWIITDQGKYLPLDLGFTVREVVTQPETQVQFLILHRDDRHACAEGRAARKSGRTLTSDRRGDQTWPV